MSQFANYLETQIANYHKGTNMPTPPTAYLGFWDGDPGEALSGGTERSATISARQLAGLGAPASKTTTNDATIDFGTAAAGCSITHWALLDASTAGNGLVYGALTASKTINTADPVEVAADALTITIGGTATDALAERILNWLRGTAPGTAPATLYARLYDGNPLSGGTEVTATIRPAGGVAITFGTVTDGVLSNSGIIDFGTAAGAADVTHIAVNTAATGAGENWHTVAVTTTRNVNAGDPVTFAAGALALTIA